MQGAHVVQAVSELNEKNANVICNREQKLAEVFSLFCFAGDQIQTLDLCQAIDQLADFLAKHAVDFCTSGVGVLNGVMKEGDCNCCVVKLQIREDCCNFEGVGNIWIPRGTSLGAMLLHSINIGLVEQCFIRVRIVAGYFLNKFILTHHFRAAASL